MKSIDVSRAMLSEVMQPSQENPFGTVHGGELIKIMDTCGGVTAKRHAGTMTVTARIDELIFHESVYVGEQVICKAHLIFVGRSSMAIRVKLFKEKLTVCEPPRLALSGYFTYVALDKDRKPCPVEGLELATQAQKEEFERIKTRYIKQKQSL